MDVMRFVSASLIVVCLSGLVGTLDARAATTVPLELQVELLRKIIKFERGFAGRGGPTVKVMIVHRPGLPASERAAAQLRNALKGDIGGREVAATSHTFSTIATLAQAIRAESAQLVYFAPGFNDEFQQIASGLAGLTVLTVSTDGDAVDRGAVLGFELNASRPRIALNDAQARKQGLNFNSDLFRIARVIR